MCLTGARITRQLSLRGAKLANGSGPALAADLLTVRAGLMADQGFTATGAAGPCTVQLREARITGELSFERATVVNYPVQGQSGDASPGSGDGAVCLSGAAIGGAVGGLAGALIGLGIPEYEAKQYESKLRTGNVLIAVHIDDAEEATLVRQIMEEEQAEDISTGTEAAAAS